MAVGRVYVLKDAAGIRRYAGSSKTSESVRLANHKSVLAHDPLASGLYRYVHANGGFDGWTIETVMTIDLDQGDGDADAAQALLESMERNLVRALRQLGCPLLNTNEPRCQDAQRRASQQAWRIAHGQGQVNDAGQSLSYMAVKSREHRARRKRKLGEQQSPLARQRAVEN